MTERNKTAKPPLLPRITGETRIFLAASFFAPILVLGVMFALHQVFPFGDRQIMVTDFWQQYYPFLSDFWHKIREGSSLLWSWSGTGVNYPAMIAYYLASPLNLLAALFPHAWLREVMTVLLLVKIGAAGLFFALFLRHSFGRSDLSLPVFSLCYALCAFTMGYYWNLMWFDTFALSPLVILGLSALVRDGKYRLYTIALALAVGINYYVGFFICLITAFLFFVFCFVRELDLKTAARRLLLIAGCTVLGLGMTAALTLPAYSALQLSYSAVNKFPDSLTWYESFVDILGNFIAFSAPSDKEGLPNLYCGFLSVLLFAVFLSARSIKWREKLAYLALLAFLLVSCNLNVLNYIWHGFHFTNMIPYRFSFLISFLLIFCAYRAYTLLEELCLPDLAVMAVFGGGFLVMAYFGPQPGKAVAGSAGMLVFYLLAFLFYTLRALTPKQLLRLLAFGVLIEISVSAYIGVDTVRTTSRPPYPDRYAEVEALLAGRAEDEPFYRTEFARWYTLNDPSLYRYDGVSTFSSTVNVSTTYFLEGVGLSAWDTGNRYAYAETSPLTNALLNIRYLVARSDTWSHNSDYWREVAREGDATLLENERLLPFGFLAPEELAGYGVQDNPFLSQNELFRRLTGLTGDLFTVIDMVHVGHQNLDVHRQSLGNYRYEENGESEGKLLKWNYEVPEDGMYFVYASIDGVTEARIVMEGEILDTAETKRAYLFPAGQFGRGEIFSVMADVPGETERGNARIFVAHLNDALFDMGYRILSENPMELTEFSETKVSGTIHAPRDGLLYTSIPYEPGWRAFVDGAETGIIPLGGSMAMVPLTSGDHTVEFRYFPGGMQAGLLVTGLSVLVFLAVVWVERKGFLWRKGPENR